MVHARVSLGTYRPEDRRQRQIDDPARPDQSSDGTAETGTAEPSDDGNDNDDQPSLEEVR